MLEYSVCYMIFLMEIHVVVGKDDVGGLVGGGRKQTIGHVKTLFLHPVQMLPRQRV